ncbi:hypothetical protein NE237_014574 [Protea cynaroides]|uniref:Glycolipid transfer protein domain-containing protein n=1 Tax=Protea cynaroides TaxID=273540 RepID=A0A9Q0QQ93_9MAGN|nr:hypothetical protein NE237_014574 [Protea cynaroides]
MLRTTTIRTLMRSLYFFLFQFSAQTVFSHSKLVGFSRIHPNQKLKSKLDSSFSLCFGLLSFPLSAEIVRMEGTVFTPSLEGMKHVKAEDGKMLTKPFLDVCKFILPVIDKFGAAMMLVKTDIGGNISRLEAKYLSNPVEFNHLYDMVQAEVQDKTAKGSSSCTNGLLWLTRAMDFIVALFRNLLEHPDWTMSQACTDSYSKTLKQWHGWLASSSFTVAMKLAPDRKKFMDVIAGGGDINTDIEKFCSTFAPFLEENHKFLESVGMDNLKAS